MQIMFENAGEYEIVFLYEDLFSEGTFSYELTVLTSENVRFGEIYLPEYFIKDAAYTLDPVSVFIYGEKYRTEVAAEVFASSSPSLQAGFASSPAGCCVLLALCAAFLLSLTFHKNAGRFSHMDFYRQACYNLKKRKSAVNRKQY